MRCAFSLSLLALAWTAACTPVLVPVDRTDRRERVLQIDTHVGGTHHRTLVAGGKWYQAFSNELLVIDPATGRTTGSVEVVPFGEGGPVVDLAVDGNTVWAISDYTCAAAIDVSAPGRPTVQESVSAKELGIDPHYVSLAGGEVWVTGDGGAVRLRDRQRFLAGQTVGRVVQTAAGPATTSGRRILMVQDGRYMGAATDLQPLPPGFGPDGGYLFVLQGGNGAQVGLMSPFFTEVASVAIPGVIRRARVVGDRVCIVHDRGLEFWRLQGGKLHTPEEVRLKGGRDIDCVEPNSYVVSGSFGRGNFRLVEDQSGPGDTFFNVQREPGLLEVAVKDPSRILAGGREGFWLWEVGKEPQRTDASTQVTTLITTSVDAAWGSAQVVEDKEKPELSNRIVRIKHDGTSTDYSPAGSPRVFNLTLVNGDLWVGHERGIDVLRRTGTEFKRLNEFRFEGPVLFIFPQIVGGGATAVSLHGGLMAFKTVRVGEAPVFEEQGKIEGAFR